MSGSGSGSGFFVPPSALDPIVRALTYPYPAPDHDFIFRDGGVSSIIGG